MTIDNQTFKILVVDDQPSNLRCLSNILTQRGYKVQRAISGQLALNAAKSSPPDLILLDIIMPEMTGFEVCKRLKANEQTRDIPVIFLSVLDEATDKVKAFKVGGVDYITKPFQVEEVLARIENHLEIQILQKQLELKNQVLQEEILIRNAAQAELQETKDSLELVLCASNDGFWEWNLQTGEVYFSPRWKEMLGYEEDEIYDQFSSWEQLIFAEDKIAALNLIEAYNSGGVKEFTTTQRFYHKNGSTVHILVRAIHLKDESGQVVRMIFSHTDVSELVKTSEALAQSKSLLASVLDSSQEGIAALASVRNNQGNIVDFKFLLVNPSAEKIVRIKAEKLIERYLLEKLPWTEETGLFDDYVRVVETGEIFSREVHYNFEGIQAWFHVVAVKLGDGLAVTFCDITQKKQDQQELLIARERLEYLLSSNPSVIYSCKTTDNYGTTFVSKNVTALLGYEPGEILESDNFWGSHMHPEDKERVWAEMPQLMAQGYHAGEYRFLHKDGTYRWIYDAIKLVRDAAGNPIEIIGSLSDITERKQIEQALQESQRFIQKLSEANPNILYVYDLIEQQNVYINREIDEILDYTPEDLKQMGTDVVQTLMHPEDLARFREYLKQFETGKDGDIFEFEYRMRHKNGEYFWFFSRDTLFARTADGKPKQILGAATNITQRKQAEAQLRQQKELLQTIFDNIPVMLMLYDPAGNMLLTNRHLELVLGWSWAELANRNLLVECYQNREYRARVVEFMEAATGKWQDFKTTTRDGRVIDTCWANIMLSDGNCIGIGQDITERKQAEEALRISEERFQLAIEASGLGLWDWHINTGIVYYSPEWKTMLGYAVEEIEDRYQSWERLVHPEDLPTALAALEANWQRRSLCYEVEFRMTSKEGEWKWIISRGRVTERDEMGNPVRMTGTHKDISDRKQIQSALQESERKFRAIFNNTFQFTGLLTPDGTLIEANQTALDFCGIESRDAVGRPYWETRWWTVGKEDKESGGRGDAEIRDDKQRGGRGDAESRDDKQRGGRGDAEIREDAKRGRQARGSSENVPASPRPPVPASSSLTPTQQQLRDAIALAANGEFVRYEVDIRGAGKTIATIDFSLKPVLDDAGNVVLLIPEGRDISDKKRDERVKTALINCLEQSEARLSQIVTTISEGLIVQDDNDRILFVNGAGLTLFGRSYEEVLHTSLGLPITLDELTEIEIIRPCSEIIVAEMRALRITWDHKAAYLITLRDITARKQAEIALQQSEARLQKLADNVPGMLYEFLLHPDGSYNFAYVSSGCKEINELEPQQLIENPELAFQLSHPDDRQKLHESIATSARTLEPWFWEGLISTPSGKQKWIQGAAKPEPCDNGDILWHGVLIDTSDRKAADEALRQSEARLQKLTASVPGLIYEFMLHPDGSYCFTYVSSGCREIYELEPQQLLENVALGFEQVHPNDRESLMAAIAYSAQTLAPFTWEGRLIYPSGQIKWVQATSRPERLPGSQTEPGSQAQSGNEGGIIWHGVMIDVSDRKFNEALLLESQQRIAFLVQQTPIAVIEWNNDGKIIAWNSAAAEIFGYSQTEAIGQNLIDLLTPSSLQQQINLATPDLLYQRGATCSISENITKDGRIAICEWYNTALIDESGNAIGGASMAVDITERQQAQEALRESAERERAIAKAIERMRQSLDIETIFRATTEELRQVVGSDRVIIYRFNNDWSGNFVAESIGSGWVPVVQLDPEHPDFTQAVLESPRCIVKLWDSPDNLVEDTYLQRTGGGIYNQGEKYLCVSDIYQAGFSNCYIELLETFQAKAYITVPIFCGNKLWGLLATYQNTGPRLWSAAEINIVVQIGNQLGVALQQAELLTQLKLAKEAADAANKAKSQFLARMSHELRTPLNAILGFSQLLARSDSLEQGEREHLAIINRSGEHLLDLINDILSMSKIEAGQIALNENCFDLYRLLTAIEDMFQLKAKSKGLELKFERATQVPQYVKTDESKLRQVLINLLGNAIKFTTSGSVKLLLKTAQEQVTPVPEENIDSNAPLHSDRVTLWFNVEDTGPGIAPEELSTIFKPFVQSQIGRQSMEGTGLGLPISQQFVKLMGGEIGVTSQQGIGSTFTFNIQATVLSEAPESTLSDPRRVIGLEPNQPKYRILVVEDVLANRQLLLELLAPLGFEVREAENGQQGLAVWENWQPNLILMDMEMPVMDGYTATGEIKRHPKAKNTKIIALTASAFEEQRLAILNAGCDDFICKPFQEEILFEKMAQHLGVLYVYQENRSLASNGRFSAQSQSLTSEDLSCMPRNWIVALHQAALEIDDQQIIELLQQIPATLSNITKALTYLVDNFRMDIIIELTQPYSDDPPN
jgi:PAS domain S-box-containing protein